MSTFKDKFILFFCNKITIDAYYSIKDKNEISVVKKVLEYFKFKPKYIRYSMKKYNWILKQRKEDERWMEKY